MSSDIEIERLLAEAIACKSHVALVAVPHSERKHTYKSINRAANAPLFKSSKHDLRVATTSKTVTQRSERCAKPFEVVNLTIEYNHKPAATRCHWLPPVIRKVDNGQPAMPKTNTGRSIPKSAFTVGTAVSNCRGHVFQNSFR